MAAGRPTFTPTDEQKMTVAIMAASGFSEHVICERIINPSTGAKIDPKTLRKNFKVEIAEGMNTANAQVAMALFKKATGNGQQSVTAAIFWLKCRAGWKPVEGVELTGKDGVPLEAQAVMTRAEFEAIARKIIDEV